MLDAVVGRFPFLAPFLAPELVTRLPGPVCREHSAALDLSSGFKSVECIALCTIGHTSLDKRMV